MKKKTYVRPVHVCMNYISTQRPLHASQKLDSEKRFVEIFYSFSKILTDINVTSLAENKKQNILI